MEEYYFISSSIEARMRGGGVASLLNQDADFQTGQPDMEMPRYGITLRRLGVLRDIRDYLPTSELIF